MELSAFFPKEILAGNIPLVDLHVHTNFTDGVDKLESYVQAALKLGLKSIAFTEHVTLDEVRLTKWFPLFLEEVEHCKLRYTDIKIFKAVEAKVIDFQGTLNFPEKYIESVDFVMGVVHRYPGLDTSIENYSKDIPAETARNIELNASLALLENSHVSVIGHAGGVYITKFGSFPLVDFGKVIEKAAQKRVCFEINSKYHKWIVKELLELCSQHGVKVTLGSDAHNVEQLGDIVRFLEGKFCEKKR